MPSPIHEKTAVSSVPDALSKEFLEQLRSLAHADSLAWQLETVKHLAVVNGVGLAAATAVVASGSSQVIRGSASWSAGFCSVGLIVAVGLMFWRWIFGTLQARQMFSLVQEAGRRPVLRQEVAKLRLTLFWRIVTFGLAGLSLVAFIFAMVNWLLVSALVLYRAVEQTRGAKPCLARHAEDATICFGMRR